jgi:uncharacterized protein
MRVVLLTLLFALATFAQAPFSLAGHTLRPGTLESFSVAVGETEMPISVFHGGKPGPVLTLVAGTHGDEFPSVLAMHKLRAELRAGELSGTLVIVHVANMTGFQGRRIALSPVDGKNLNRVFPGKADGTVTEKVAHFLTKEVIERTDYLIDMHSGSADQQLWAHVYSPFIGDAELDKRTLAFAKATLLRHIVLYGDRPRDPARSISVPNTAMTRGKPGLTLEIGHSGQRTEEQVATVLAAVRNAMRHLKMMGGAEVVNEGFTLYRKLHEVESPVDGVFYPKTEIGELVDRGALLAEVTDYFGRKVAELRAPVRGIVLMLQHMPPVNKGQTPVTIGEWQ